MGPSKREHFLVPGKSIGRIPSLAACCPQFGNRSLLTGHVSGQHPPRPQMASHPACAKRPALLLCLVLMCPLPIFATFISVHVHYPLPFFRPQLPFKFTLDVHLIRSYLNKNVRDRKKRYTCLLVHSLAVLRLQRLRKNFYLWQVISYYFSKSTIKMQLLLKGSGKNRLWAGFSSTLKASWP